jgi:hypothetical protein
LSAKTVTTNVKVANQLKTVITAFVNGLITHGLSPLEITGRDGCIGSQEIKAMV